MFRSAFFALLGFGVVVGGIVMILNASYRSEPGFDIWRYRAGPGEESAVHRDQPGRRARRRSLLIGIGMIVGGIGLLVLWGSQF